MRALAVWRRNALVWRKLVVPSLVFNFGEPVLYLFGLGFGLGRFIGDMAGMPYLSFIATGLLASSSMNAASYEGMFSAYTRMVPQQTWDALMATPLGIDDIVMGEALWCATKSVISASAILLVSFAFGAIDSPLAFACIPAFALIGLCFAGPALSVSALAPSYDFFNYYITMFMTPMFIFCGVFYPVAALPALARDLVALLPLTHAVGIVRPLATGSLPDSLALHVGVLAAWAIAGLLLAGRLARRRLVR